MRQLKLWITQLIVVNIFLFLVWFTIFCSFLTISLFKTSSLNLIEVAPTFERIHRAGSRISNTFESRWLTAIWIILYFKSSWTYAWLPAATLAAVHAASIYKWGYVERIIHETMSLTKFFSTIFYIISLSKLGFSLIILRIPMIPKCFSIGF